jgi:amino acid transporter
LNSLAGFLFLIPLVFVLPDSQELIALVSGQPVPTIMKSAVGNSTGAFLLLLPLIVLSLICGIGCTTTVSRSIWAFARDGGIPYSSKWRQVNKSLDVPFNAMMLGMVVQIALGLIYFGSTTAFNAFSGVGVITLTVSYACPIAVSFLGGRKQIKNGEFDLGKLGAVCNVVALGKIREFPHLPIPYSNLHIIYQLGAYLLFPYSACPLQFPSLRKPLTMLLWFSLPLYLSLLFGTGSGVTKNTSGHPQPMTP